MDPERPLPAPLTPEARPYWDGLKEGKLMVPRCNACGKPFFYPRVACPHCFADALDWVQASGRGTLYSYTVVHNNAPSAFVADVPYVVAVVELEEGVRMASNLVDCDHAALRCDMPVEVTFERLDDEFTLPKFRPRGG